MSDRSRRARWLHLGSVPSPSRDALRAQCPRESLEPTTVRAKSCVCWNGLRCDEVPSMEGPNAQLKTCHESAIPKWLPLHIQRSLGTAFTGIDTEVRPAPPSKYHPLHTHTIPFLLPLPASRFSNLFSRSPWACAFVLRGSLGCREGHAS